MCSAAIALKCRITSATTHVSSSQLKLGFTVILFSQQTRPETIIQMSDPTQILIVDDGITFRHVLVLQLAHLGLKADSAANGMEAYFY